MARSMELQAFIDSVFPEMAQAIQEGKCPICKGEITEFKDELSVREYEISGMCQKCQDEFFD